MSKLSGPEQVAEYFAALDHPLKDVLLRVREAILSADGGLTEHIKWKAPSFCHAGDDRVTFNLYRDGSLLLIFHRGAKVKDVKGNERLIDDPTGLLEWLSNDRASLKIADETDLEKKQADIVKLVKLWIAAA